MTAPSVEEIPTTMRQTSFTVPTGGSSDGDAATTTTGALIHVSVQHFVDALWILVTEDANCSPGVVFQHTAPDLGPSAFMYDGETPSLECTVLVGLRDHPLSNLTASTVAHAVRNAGEGRMLMMAISVVNTAKALVDTAQRKTFLAAVKKNVLEMCK